MARYRPGGQNRVRRRFKSASSSKRRAITPTGTPVQQNGLMPGQVNINSTKVIQQMFPMGHLVEDCRNANPPLHDEIFGTCLKMADDFGSVV